MRLKNTLPLVAVIIPIYKQPRLLSDAVNSVLNQRTRFPVKLILINDGCPYQETHEIGRAYAYTYTEKIDYLYQANGGLSSARNYGIEYVLAKYPETSAVFFLDADNVLIPSALQNSFDYLHSTPGVDWVYPDIETFGIQHSYAYAGNYSLLLHAHCNICEAGSLISTVLFKEGLRFDENMRDGYEDWDFWLSAARKGFRGAAMADFGFRYRYRPESMLAASNRTQQKILAYIHQKHNWLFNPKKLISLEHQDHPRYCFYDMNTKEIVFATDLQKQSRMTSSKCFVSWYWHVRTEPFSEHIPPFMVFCDFKWLKSLSRQGLLYATLWHMEEGLNNAEVSLIVDKAINRPDSFVQGIKKISPPYQKSYLKTPLLMLRNTTFYQAVSSDNHWIDDLLNEQRKVKLYVLELKRSEGVESHANAFSGLKKLFGKIKHSKYNKTALIPWNWKESTLPQRSQLPEKNRLLISGDTEVPNANIYPLVKNDQRHIGFILPFAGFGGAERAVYALATRLKKRHWVPHLFVTHHSQIELPIEYTDTFTTIDFLSDSEVNFEGHYDRYWGTKLTQWTQKRQHKRVISRLCWLDVVINCQSADLNNIMGSLQELGVKTISYVHVVDHTLSGRSVGHPFQALAYEYAYQLILTCSKQMKIWFQSVGIPRAKLLQLPNAPGYDIDSKVISQVLTIRKNRLKTLSVNSFTLRILFLGRFDRQKGMDRLIRLIEACSAERLPVDWRVIGKSVLNDSDINLAPIEQYIESPITNAEGLTSIYSWADILFLPSRWEGVPLSILESMRLGCVPIATNVGAVHEIVSHDKNGILLDNTEQGFVHHTKKLLLNLLNNPDRLIKLSSAAAQNTSNWNETTDKIEDRLKLLFKLA